jgi:predicted ATPase
MRVALARHDEIVRTAMEGRGGYVFATGGDGFAVAFGRAGDAVAASIEAQASLAAERWPEDAGIRVRMGLHTGEVDERDGDYFGPAVNRAARLMALGHGGQTLCSSATAELVDGVELVDLGEHRLRDLSEPQRVFQVGSGWFRALRSLDGLGSNLPAQTSVFVGRELELGQVASLLAASRIVTLTGVGGVGKTRLALHAGAELLPRFRDGVWLVELAPVLDPGALFEVVAGAMRVPERQGMPLAASVRDFLRGKRLLVVLDNCEHLLDAVATFVAGVVAACPDVSVLATSREGLGVDGERMLVVPSLELPAAGSPLGVVGEADAVRLFVERAGEARPDFVLTAANADSVAQLVRRLDGIPLAIELAAARVRSLSPAELAERVDERFRLLAGGRRTAVERHQTLRRAVDWSYDLLTEAEQVVLNRTAVFAGDFSLASGEAVIASGLIDPADVVDLLGRLVDKSLIVAADREGVTRYRLLETIREYAQERLETAGSADELRRRHAEHFAVFSAAAGEGLRGREEVAWTERVDAELDNLRAALGWSVAMGEVDLALRLVAPLAVSGTRTGYTTCAWAASVKAMHGSPSHGLYPQVLAMAGYAEASNGDLDAGMRTCRAALQVADATGIDGRATCRVLASAAAVATYANDLADMSYLARRWAELARAIGDDWELAIALVCAANVSYTTGDEPGATMRADEALGLARRVGNPTTSYYAALVAGWVRRDNDPGQALRLLAQSVEAAELVGNQLGIGQSLGVQASIRG